MADGAVAGAGVGVADELKEASGGEESKDDGDEGPGEAEDSAVIIPIRVLYSLDPRGRPIGEQGVSANLDVVSFGPFAVLFAALHRAEADGAEVPVEEYPNFHGNWGSGFRENLKDAELTIPCSKAGEENRNCGEAREKRSGVEGPAAQAVRAGTWAGEVEKGEGGGEEEEGAVPEGEDALVEYVVPAVDEVAVGVDAWVGNYFRPQVVPEDTVRGNAANWVFERGKQSDEISAETNVVRVVADRVEHLD